MVEIIDEDGDLFGVVNIVDALVVLLLVAVFVAGIALLTGNETTVNETTVNETTVNETAIVVTFQSKEVQPYVARSIPESPVQENNISMVQNKSISPTQVVVQSESGNLSVQSHPTLKTVTLHVELTVIEQDGEYMYRGKKVQVGISIELDFGTTTVSGHITGINSSAPEVGN